ETKYCVSREIWNSLNVYNKQGLILHEAIYELFREEGINNADSVAIVYLIISFPDLKVIDYPSNYKTLKSQILHSKKHSLSNYLNITSSNFDEVKRVFGTATLTIKPKNSR